MAGRFGHETGSSLLPCLSGNYAGMEQSIILSAFGIIGTVGLVKAAGRIFAK